VRDRYLRIEVGSELRWVKWCKDVTGNVAYVYTPPMLLLINFVHEGASQQVPPKRHGAIYNDYSNISLLDWIT
jgi:hypothetical protein